MVNMAKPKGGRRSIVAMIVGASLAELQSDIDDLNERQYPVKFCKCLGTEFAREMNRKGRVSK